MRAPWPAGRRPRAVHHPRSDAWRQVQRLIRIAVTEPLAGEFAGAKPVALLCSGEVIGTKHVVFEPLDFVARLAALVPKPRVHLTRYHGVFAAHSRWRSAITPAGRGSRKATTETRTPAKNHRAMTWAQRLSG